MIPQYTLQTLDREALKISDGQLNSWMEHLTPLIKSGGQLCRFKLPDLRNSAFTWAPEELEAVTDIEGWIEVSRGQTQHSCGHPVFFKPSIAEVVAQIPDDGRIAGFYLDVDSLVTFSDGSGHLCNVVWLTNDKRRAEMRESLMHRGYAPGTIEEKLGS